MAGSNLATNWGSFGFFGPLTVRPELWNQHIAQKLLGPTMDLLEKWGVREAGLFTFAHSPKHIGLYQRFGFWPRFLTAIMSKSVNGREASSIKYSALNEGERDQALSACRKLTGSIYEGLDVSTEIRSIKDQNLGETVLLWGGDSLDAFAVCHCGEGSEAGRNTCFIKFAAYRSLPQPEPLADRRARAYVLSIRPEGLGIRHAKEGAKSDTEDPARFNQIVLLHGTNGDAD